MIDMNPVIEYAKAKGKVSREVNEEVFNILTKIAQVVLVRFGYTLVGEDREDMLSDIRLYALEGLTKPHIDFEQYDCFNLIFSRMRNYITGARRKQNRMVYFDSVEPAPYSLSTEVTLSQDTQEIFDTLVCRAEYMCLDVERYRLAITTAALFRGITHPDASLRPWCKEREI